MLLSAHTSKTPKLEVCGATKQLAVCSTVVLTCCAVGQWLHIMHDGLILYKVLSCCPQVMCRDCIGPGQLVKIIKIIYFQLYHDVFAASM